MSSIHFLPKTPMLTLIGQFLNSTAGTMLEAASQPATGPLKRPPKTRQRSSSRKKGRGEGVGRVRRAKTRNRQHQPAERALTRLDHFRRSSRSAPRPVLFEQDNFSERRNTYKWKFPLEFPNILNPRCVEECGGKKLKNGSSR
jgi:hypothetical protein